MSQPGGNPYQGGKPFKFKSLEVFSSTEYMIHSTRKARQVYDRSELTYVNAEFSFYNKFFDEQTWEAKISLKAYEVKDDGTRNELAVLEQDVVVTPDQNVVSVHKGWGNKRKGAYWLKGTYEWDACVNGEVVGTARFYIEDTGATTDTENPYFDVQSIKLFHTEKSLTAIPDRKYMVSFKKDIVQYIGVEVNLANKVEKPWWGEFIFLFYDDAFQLKTRTVVLQELQGKDTSPTFTIDSGWGDTSAGSVWKDDKYFVQIVFQDVLVATVEFKLSDADEPGIASEQPVTGPLARRMNLPGDHNGIAPPSTSPSGSADSTTTQPAEPQTVEEAIARLNELVGMEQVKRRIREHLQYLDFLKLRKEKGFADDEPITLHSVFTGNPGTGKTTVVKLLGRIYHLMGLLSKGQVIEVDRADVVANFIGQTASKVKDLIKESRGNILFIDEAYSLARDPDDTKDFGREAIEVLLKEMSDGPGDIAICVAGYPKEMDIFLESNPGLKSRFKHFFHFEDYLPQELIQITRHAAGKRFVHFLPEAETHLEKIMTDAWRNRDRTFGNARYAIRLVDEAKMQFGLRIMQQENHAELTADDLSTITLADVQKIDPHQNTRVLDLNIDRDLLNTATHQLNELVGLNSIKGDVNDMIKLVKYYRETGRDVLNHFSLHTVFTGNPGTGKTTVARILGQVYRALGLLERGHLIETDREGLVAGYVGQTAIKTKEKMDEAKDGILFIDEAYALAMDGNEYAFGKEALTVVLKNMEDLRGRMAVIVAGYPENMQTFLQANPGLTSRFDRSFHFEDYTTDEMWAIAERLLAKDSLTPTDEAAAHLQAYFQDLLDRKDKHFGNARVVRKTIEGAIKQQHLRMSGLDPAARTADIMARLDLVDVAGFSLSPVGYEPAIGFRRR